MISGKLVQGVVYEIDKREEVNKVLNDLHFSETKEFDTLVQHKASNYPNATLEQCKNHFINANAILSLIGENSGCTYASNMIIPKEALSDELKDALTPLDISKDVLEEYRDDFGKLHGIKNKKELRSECRHENKSDHAYICNSDKIFSVFDELNHKFPNGFKCKIKSTPKETIVDANQELTYEDISLLKSIFGGMGNVDVFRF